MRRVNQFSPGGTTEPEAGRQGRSRWSVVLPYVNERNFIGATLESLCRQSMRDFELILVDNGSDDGTEAHCREVLSRFPDIEVQYLFEARPGKTHALETGINACSTPFVATCDADTIYPRHYLQRCDELFETGGPDVVAVMALDIYGEPGNPKWRVHRHWKVLVSRCLSWQAHTGGYGQTFRLDALRNAGGFATRLWPYVLEDHEIMHRVLKFGRSRYHPSLWCQPSQRRASRSNVGWNVFERLLYHATPYSRQDWFFYTFLSGRLGRRGLDATRLRVNRSWEDPQQ